jgi:hypothetical protein
MSITIIAGKEKEASKAIQEIEELEASDED